MVTADRSELRRTVREPVAGFGSGTASGGAPRRSGRENQVSRAGRVAIAVLAGAAAVSWRHSILLRCQVPQSASKTCLPRSTIKPLPKPAESTTTSSERTDCWPEPVLRHLHWLR